ncbi:MAG: DNA pilot protein [Microviridae sp.]|nr:MAG: DNA pilot protein [Microviridae sp.]
METMVSLSGIASGVASLLPSIGSYQENKESIKAQREQARLDREHQEKINAQNRAEAERIRLINARRQDSQIQRQVADGRLAGLSPLAAMGNAGYSPAIASLAQSSPSRFSPITKTSGASLAGDAIQNMLQQQNMNQQILESRSRTLLNEANATKIANENNGIQLPTHASDGREIRNSTILVRTASGQLVEMPNNELMEGLTPKEMAMFNATLAGSRVMGNRVQQKGSNVILEKSLPRKVKDNFNFFLRQHGGY